MYTLSEILKEVKQWDVPEEIDYRRECAKQFPKDLWLMDDCHTPHEQEDMWYVIVSLNDIPEWRYAR